VKNDWTIIILGVVSAVIAALAVDWIQRSFGAPTCDANTTAWKNTVTGGGQQALPNFNQNPESPASTYQGGAPVTNYRPYQRIGVLEVPVE
jgi:hypothetical protein